MVNRVVIMSVSSGRSARQREGPRRDEHRRPTMDLIIATLKVVLSPVVQMALELVAFLACRPRRRAAVVRVNPRYMSTRALIARNR